MKARIAATTPEVRYLALLTAAAAGACGFAAAFPLAPGRPVVLLVVLTVLGALLSIGLMVGGRRVTHRVLVVVVAVIIVVASILVGAAYTTGGALLTAYAYVWLTVYSGLVLSRRATLLHAALVTVGFGAGLLASGLPDTATAWVLITATVWASGIALSRLSERARHHAETDLLTGVLNRRAFMAAAEREHDLAGRTRADLSLVLIDLDEFKVVNDRDGHAAGDRLLAELATAWHDVLRPADVLARHGGDEFAVLLPATSDEGAARVVARLRAAHPTAWSAGIATWRPAESLDAALARADAGLYAAKRARTARAAGAVPPSATAPTAPRIV